MCGRFALRTSTPELARMLGLDPDAAVDLPAEVAGGPRYNIAPGQGLLVCRAAREGGPALAAMRWGLVPSWAKEARVGYRMINARAETVAEKPSFRSALRRRRCLIPADGYYEWQGREGAKQPWLIHREDEAAFVFAGLWEHWTRGEAPLTTCTVITVPAAGRVEAVHHRMPLILPPERWAQWLDPSLQDARVLAGLLATPDTYEALRLRPVSTLVNNARNEDPRCVDPADAP